MITLWDLSFYDQALKGHPAIDDQRESTYIGTKCGPSARMWISLRLSERESLGGISHEMYTGVEIIVGFYRCSRWWKG